MSEREPRSGERPHEDYTNWTIHADFGPDIERVYDESLLHEDWDDNTYEARQFTGDAEHDERLRELQTRIGSTFDGPLDDEVVKDVDRFIAERVMAHEEVQDLDESSRFDQLIQQDRADEDDANNQLLQLVTSLRTGDEGRGRSLEEMFQEMGTTEDPRVQAQKLEALEAFGMALQRVAAEREEMDADEQVVLTRVGEMAEWRSTVAQTDWLARDVERPREERARLVESFVGAAREYAQNDDLPESFTGGLQSVADDIEAIDLDATDGQAVEGPSETGLIVRSDSTEEGRDTVEAAGTDRVVHEGEIVVEGTGQSEELDPPPTSEEDNVITLTDDDYEVRVTQRGDEVGGVADEDAGGRRGEGVSADVGEAERAAGSIERGDADAEFLYQNWDATRHETRRERADGGNYERLRKLREGITSSLEEPLDDRLVADVERFIAERVRADEEALGLDESSRFDQLIRHDGADADDESNELNKLLRGMRTEGSSGRKLSLDSAHRLATGLGDDPSVAMKKLQALEAFGVALQRVVEEAEEARGDSTPLVLFDEDDRVVHTRVGELVELRSLAAQTELLIRDNNIPPGERAALAQRFAKMVFDYYRSDDLPQRDYDDLRNMTSRFMASASRLEVEGRENGESAGGGVVDQAADEQVERSGDGVEEGSSERATERSDGAVADRQSETVQTAPVEGGVGDDAGRTEDDVTDSEENVYFLGPEDVIPGRDDTLAEMGAGVAGAQERDSGRPDEAAAGEVGRGERQPWRPDAVVSDASDQGREERQARVAELMGEPLSSETLDKVRMVIEGREEDVWAPLELKETDRLDDLSNRSDRAFNRVAGELESEDGEGFALQTKLDILASRVAEGDPDEVMEVRKELDAVEEVAWAMHEVAAGDRHHTWDEMDEESRALERAAQEVYFSTVLMRNMMVRTEDLVDRPQVLRGNRDLLQRYMKNADLREEFRETLTRFDHALEQKEQAVIEIQRSEEAERTQRRDELRLKWDRERLGLDEVEGPGVPDTSERLSRRKEWLTTLTEGVTSDMPHALHDELNADDFLERGRREQDSGEVRRLIPDRYFPGGERDLTRPVNRVVTGLSGGESLEKIAACKNCSEEDRVQQRVALKVVGQRLVQGRQEADPRDLEQVPADDRLTVVYGHMLMQEVEMQWIDDQVEAGTLDDNLSVDRARVLATKFGRWGEREDMPDTFRQRLLATRDQLAEMVEIEETTELMRASTAEEAEREAWGQRREVLEGQIAGLQSRLARRGTRGMERVGLEGDLAVLEEELAQLEEVDREDAVMLESAEGTQADQSNQAREIIDSIQAGGSFAPGTRETVSSVFEAKAQQLEEAGEGQRAQRLRNYAEAMEYDLRQGGTAIGRRMIRGQVSGRTLSPQPIDQERRGPVGFVKERFRELREEFGGAAKGVKGEVTREGGQRAIQARADAIAALREAAQEEGDEGWQQLYTALAGEYEAINRVDSQTWRQALGAGWQELKQAWVKDDQGQRRGQSTEAESAGVVQEMSEEQRAQVREEVEMQMEDVIGRAHQATNGWREMAATELSGGETWRQVEGARPTPEEQAVMEMVRTRLGQSLRNGPTVRYLAGLAQQRGLETVDALLVSGMDDRGRARLQQAMTSNNVEAVAVQLERAVEVQQGERQELREAQGRDFYEAVHRRDQAALERWRVDVRNFDESDDRAWAARQPALADGDDIALLDQAAALLQERESLRLAGGQTEREQAVNQQLANMSRQWRERRSSGTRAA